MDGKIYLVEISRNTKKVFILLFPNFEQPEEYLSEVLAEKVAMKLMSDNQNLFENFVKNFYVKFGKLQIQGYHGKGTTRKPQSNLNSSDYVSAGFEIKEAFVVKSKVVQDHAYGTNETEENIIT